MRLKSRSATKHWPCNCSSCHTRYPWVHFYIRLLYLIERGFEARPFQFHSWNSTSEPTRLKVNLASSTGRLELRIDPSEDDCCLLSLKKGTLDKMISAGQFGFSYTRRGLKKCNVGMRSRGPRCSELKIDDRVRRQRPFDRRASVTELGEYFAAWASFGSH